ncbi:MAG: DUF58 domain-containing protein [Bacteroidetes bacterium]|nr:MAG: DUF58 domain-containing protein [Bacteroidota bacterium]MBL1145435.1 DUF58 domain-containing protein [Bacteroidota bacterium]MCB0802912.1 DUF58 domain-containing protein [Flavobacteriales bacterium]NOG58233.1 DUF58 domain-containing protein [Bacteroidota bacterium]
MPIINRKELQAYSHLELLAKQVVEGFITGLHKSPFHGFSVEFAEHRLYNTGESTRHLDWKLFAKTDKLFVKRYEEETNLRCRVILDISSSMYFPEELEKGQHNKMFFSVYAAAALVELLKKQRDAYGLSLFSQEVELHTEAKSNSAHQRLIFAELEKLLEKEIPNKRTSAVEALHSISDRIHKRSLVVIFSDMLDNSEREDDLISALQHLKHNKHEVILFHVVDNSKELNFEFENRPYKFVDMESGEEVKLNPNEVKEYYVQQMQDKKAELKLKCGQYGIEFIEADISKGFNQILLPFLVKRKKMF